MPEAPRPLGWATADLIHLDTMAPGLIGRVLTTSPRRRQAIFTVLASRASGAGERADVADDHALADVLKRERAREILAYTFGDVPEGWISALEKLDERPPVTVHAYLHLREIYADPANRAMAALLKETGLVSERKLAVLNALDPRWRLRGVLERIDSTVAAREMNRALDWVQSVCSSATDSVLSNAINRLPLDKSLGDLVMRYVRRADRFPLHPVKRDRDLRPIEAARDFIESGRHHRNCLGDRIEDALAGRAAYAEFREEAILEFRPLASGFGWVLHDVHGPRDSLVSEDIRAAAQAKSLEIGIPHVDGREHVPDLTRLCRFLRTKAAPVVRNALF